MAVMRHVEANAKRKEALRRKEKAEEEKQERQEEVYRALTSLTAKVDNLYAGREANRRGEDRRK